jgi:hypothetical protein
MRRNEDEISPWVALGHKRGCYRSGLLLIYFALVFGLIAAGRSPS